MAYASYQHNPSARGNGRQRGISGLNEELPSSPIQILSPPIHESETTGSIENAEYIGSYNWVENDGRTIIVPGSPPVCTNRALPYAIPSDAEIRPADYHIPLSALLPLMKAVDIVGKEIDWPVVDFVTDRNNLRKLMRWLQNGSKERDFRIDTQLAGEHNVLFNIFENRTRGNTDWRSYGESFEHETTPPAPG
ncbi:hypothetical protein EWM64_g2375 [Hericium alpestre]|uniref:Uncharacterized protein n=1 Tax=Hericium alpestre TaxID=135208 RepID=A0A4Z0A6V4_9AGAM|nr:hypothetical protein EWM64_g2375 [Hericium alpestre]